MAIITDFTSEDFKLRALAGGVPRVDLDKVYQTYITGKVTLPNGGLRDRTEQEQIKAQQDWDNIFKTDFEMFNRVLDGLGVVGSQQDSDNYSSAQARQKQDVPEHLLRYRPDITGVSAYSTRYGGTISEENDPWAKRFRALNPTKSTVVSSSAPSPSDISALPSSISPSTQTAAKPAIKTAPIDLVQFDNDLMPISVIQDLLFQNIGGQELISTARTDTVNGQPVIYQIIKNLTSIQQQYNPNNIISLQDTSDKYFDNFTINFDARVPDKPLGQEYVYINPENGDLVIEAVNLRPDEQIEVQIRVSGTIYEAEL
jgi:hypothetical protein